MKISLVVAIAENNAIGNHGDLLWHLPKDMKRFKEITWGHYVLMGRKTFKSIPEKFRPLPGRPNIVLTNSTRNFEGCFTVASIVDAIAIAKQNGESELMVIGGGKIYEQLLPMADKIYLTIVHHTFEADTFFPAIDNEEWIAETKEFIHSDEKHKYDMTFVDFVRK